MIVDLERLYNRTYSAITVDKGSAAYFDVRFEGTGIDVYFMLPNNLSGQPPNDEKAYFILDGETDGPPFIWTAQNTSEIEYNQRIYSKTGLHQSMHTLRVGLPNATQETQDYYLSFDYALVT
ncbi:hypothetical protein DL96DRAFT_740525 [Flagelloscypha sp. PMI_526]|nr:hypothetical protein DL96DRAFT_740525 [Flagelloscypha sp. PMI_526]